MSLNLPSESLVRADPDISKGDGTLVMISRIIKLDTATSSVLAAAVEIL